MATYELEPCPCCGAPGQMKDIHNKIRQGWVGCPVCSLYISWKISPEGAVEKWNRRQPSRYKPNYGAMVLAALDPLLELREAVDKLTEILAGGASPAPAKKKEVDP